MTFMEKLNINFFISLSEDYLQSNMTVSGLQLDQPSISGFTNDVLTGIYN